MRKITWIVATLLAFVAAPAAAAAQSQFGFGVRAGVSLPMGSYGDDAGTDAGFANLGFSAGLDLWYPLTMMSGLSWYTSAEVAAHSIDEDIAEDEGYLLFPLLTGLRFDIPVGMVSLYLTGQGGLLVTRGPGDNASWGTDFGFAFGGGANVTENIYIGTKYYPLGDVSFESDDPPLEVEREVSYLDIFVGFGVN